MFKAILLLTLTMITTAANAAEDDDFTFAAQAYAMANAEQLYRNEPIIDKSGMTIPAGLAYGQARHPSSDQLKALGFMRAASAVGGDATITFIPAGCNDTKVRLCNMVVRIGVSGRTTTNTAAVGRVAAKP